MNLRLLLALALGLFAGCAPYLVQPYSTSIDNVEALRSLRGHSLNVGSFTASQAGQKSIGCRGAPIETPNQETFSEYVRKAFVDELRLAEVYSAGSDVTLTGNLNNIDVSTNRGIWKLGLTVKASNGRAFTVEETHSYRTAFSGDRACNLAAQNLTLAVQNLLGRLVRSPEFAALASSGSDAAPAAVSSAKLSQ